MTICSHSRSVDLVSFPDRYFLSLFGDGLVDLRRPFCSTDSQILGVVNRC